MVVLRGGDFAGSLRSLRRRLSARVRPASRNGKGTVGTATLLDMVLEHVVPGAADQERAARWTRRVRAVAVDIAFVDVMQTHLKGSRTGHVKRFGRSARLVAQLEIRMEGGEMKRDIRTEVLKNPFGKLAGFGRRIVQGGDEEIRDVEHKHCLASEPLKRLEYRLQMSECHAAVEVFAEGF